jgi:hypothetical protein
MAKRVARTKAYKKAAKKVGYGESEWRTLLTPKTRSQGPVLRLEFSTPNGGIAPEDFGRLFSDLWRIDEELAVRNAEPGVIDKSGSGMFVRSVSYNSPLQIDITLVKLPKGAVEAIVKFFTDLLFYPQTRKLKDAEAAERAERVRAMKIENAMRAVRLAHSLDPLQTKPLWRASAN